MHNKFTWTLFFTVLTTIAIASPSAQQHEIDAKSELSGPYFGLVPPGDTPELFAPGVVSTSGYDITPTFSPGLDELFFGRRPTEGGSDNKIYHTRQIDGVWQEPALASFSSGEMEFEAQFSCDGEVVFYNRGLSLCFSEKTENDWGEAQFLAPPVDEGMCVGVAQNGNMYITANRPEGYGIWRFDRIDGQYQNPELVIPMSAHPFVAPDESYLLFDKYGAGRTSKLYVSFPNRGGNWSEPIELGQEVNATGTELIAKVSPDGEYLFFQRKLNDNTDIYWVDAGIIDSLRPEDVN